VGARALYERAAELGSAPAALALGTTYDPNRLWSLGALGLAGNKERARHWYRRASELGSAEAKARLAALDFDLRAGRRTSRAPVGDGTPPFRGGGPCETVALTAVY
jgi:TPR repeat protein